MSNKEELISKGYKAYETDEIIVFWKPDLCEHATECVRGNNKVFDVSRRPWVDLSQAPASEIAASNRHRKARRCSGRRFCNRVC